MARTPSHTPSACRIDDLRRVPHFADHVASCVWQAWWRDSGVALAALRARVEEALAGEGVPVTLVAHHDGRFLGTASLIASDMEERPDYAPWVAAVWVEPEEQRRGIGAALVDQAARAGFALGAPRVYLCTEATNLGFYRRGGWGLIEADVAGLDILARDTEPRPGAVTAG
ncbi:GNAT family N-acetyltransferase [Ancylobacter sp. G4_0304]|uniref:GNAT family N-acetyltransferase n=1 Tax=Ancylobacter sp. G4_0304 TaxID=3114289 RepID=UPI0039C5D3CD